MRDRLFGRGAVIGVASAFLALAGVAEAGIVVMKTGDVFVGRIDESEDASDDDLLMVRGPLTIYKGNSEPIQRGFIKLERRLIRWYNDASDQLTDDYFKLYVGEEFRLDPRFEKFRTRYKERQKTEEEFTELGIEELIKIRRRLTLTPKPIERKYFEVKKPSDWTVRDVNYNDGKESVFMMIAPTDSSSSQRFPARIHIHSVPRPRVSTTEQTEWYVEEIKKLSRNRLIDFKVAIKEILLDGRRKNVTMTTVSRRGENKVVADRYLLFRKKRVYFMACYARNQDYGRLKRLFKQVFASLKIYEDERPSAEPDKPQRAPAKPVASPDKPDKTPDKAPEKTPEKTPEKAPEDKNPEDKAAENKQPADKAPEAPKEPEKPADALPPAEPEKPAPAEPEPAPTEPEKPAAPETPKEPEPAAPKEPEPAAPKEPEPEKPKPAEPKEPEKPATEPEKPEPAAPKEPEPEPEPPGSGGR